MIGVGELKVRPPKALCHARGTVLYYHTYILCRYIFKICYKGQIGQKLPIPELQGLQVGSTVV
jgi:hypothetical protein